jgi:hypothetical protein
MTPPRSVTPPRSMMRYSQSNEGPKMDAGEIDPVKYGVLWERVQNMDRKIDRMEMQIEELLALANKSKGGFWMGMTIASMLGGFIAWVAGHLKG